MVIVAVSDERRIGTPSPSSSNRLLRRNSIPLFVTIVVVTIASMVTTYSRSTIWTREPTTASRTEQFGFLSCDSSKNHGHINNHHGNGTVETSHAVNDSEKAPFMKQTHRQSNINRTTSQGLHVCTCLTPNNPNNKHVPGPPKGIRWLHFPKTGTSFISTLWSYACSTRERYIDLSINSQQCNVFDRSSFDMYDFSLMKRYPWELYGAPNFFPSWQKSKEGGNNDILTEGFNLPLVGGTQHHPLKNSARDFKAPSSDQMTKLKEKNQLSRGGSEFEHNVTVAAIFRQPEQRIISAFYDGRHASGFDARTMNELNQQTSWPKKNGVPACQLPDGNEYDNPLECFARFPGIAGCMARMLTGEKCADQLFHESGLANVVDAVDVIMNQLEFIGLTEEWNESVCQFHRLFTGKVDELSGEWSWAPPLQGEFANVHASKVKKQWGVEHLHGFKDVADGVVYEAAKLKFRQIAGSERCYKFMTWDELEETLWDSEAMPFVRLDQDSKLCQPKSCSDLNKQCGEWPDGCGNTVICGLCNRGRTGLPSTWRTQCLDGKCVDYCPPWAEKGYWFRSNLQENPAISMMSSNLPLVKQREQEYVTPYDAIQTCAILCNNSDNNAGITDMDKSFRDEMCSCGTTPTKFLRSNLTFEDFSSAHDLDANCGKSRARNELNLSEDHTQPICCPYYNQKSPPPKGWIKRVGYEGDYFAHIMIECGGFGDCETFARRNDAEMAVFDIYNSICYAARNVFRLKSIYSVTKIDQDRYFFDLTKKLLN